MRFLGQSEFCISERSASRRCVRAQRPTSACVRHSAPPAYPHARNGAHALSNWSSEAPDSRGRRLSAEAVLERLAAAHGVPVRQLGVRLKGEKYYVQWEAAGAACFSEPSHSFSSIDRCERVSRSGPVLLGAAGVVRLRVRPASSNRHTVGESGKPGPATEIVSLNRGCRAIALSV